MTATHVQNIMERVSSLESRSMAVKQLQDALKQYVQILTDQREREREAIREDRQQGAKPRKPDDSHQQLCQQQWRI
jgi:hypothetical protein